MAKVNDFDAYQSAARDLAEYPGRDSLYGLIYAGLGLGGEAGEAQEQIKKAWRNDGKLNEDRREKLAYELGDVLWYVSQVAAEAKLSLAEIADANIEKLQDRQRRNVIKSEGDKR